MISSGRMRPIFSLGAALGICAATHAVSFAQNMPPDDRHIDIQLFEPAVGTRSFLTVTSAETMSRGQFTVSLGMTYLTKPLSVYYVDQANGDMLATRADVVNSVFAGSVSGGYAILDQLQVNAFLPMIFALRGDGLDAQSGQPEAGGISGTGLGDLRLEAVWRFFDAGPISLAAVPAFTVPTGVSFSSNKDVFIGERAPTFRPRVAATLTALRGKLSAGANLGLILRKPQTLYSSQVGQQITYGAAAAYHVLDRLDVIAEVFGRKGFDGNLDDSPLEADAGLRVMPGGQLAILLGLGTGVVRGVGVPSFRMFASVTWSPDYRDSDGDGVANQDDKCPDQPEDKDGFQDADGCPDPDNDGDFIVDAQDKCPTDKEDIDGFEDEDGCPDPDNDKDGIPDEKDGCPNEPEDKLPPRPDDGCPARAAEPDEGATPEVAPTTTPETAPAPTSGPALSQRLEFDGTRVRTASRTVIERTAATMRSRPDVKKWKVTVAVAKGKFDKVQERLAESQAAAIKAVLVKKGIPANAIETVGIVADAPMVRIAPTEAAPAEEPVIEIEPN